MNSEGDDLCTEEEKVKVRWISSYDVTSNLVQKLKSAGKLFSIPYLPGRDLRSDIVLAPGGARYLVTNENETFVL